MNIEENSCKPLDAKTIIYLDEFKPDHRLEQLEKYASRNVRLDFNEDLRVYFQEGSHAIKKAHKYLESDQLEDAYVLYLKYINMFTREIRKHPHYPYISLNYKAISQLRLHEARKHMKIAKERLLKYYQKIYDSFTVKNSRGDYKSLKASNTESILSTKKSTAVSFPAAPSPAHSSIKSLRSSRIFRRASHVDAFINKSKELDHFRNFRTLAIPNQLATIFQVMVQYENRQSILAWGIIAGSWKDNEYVATHLLVPHLGHIRSRLLAIGDSPECDKYIQDNQLTCLGWIHSHGSSVYLSHDDLHKHLDFQRKLPEAVAIVCSPYLCRVEFYSLLDFGIQYISQCKERAERLHVHKTDQPLYTKAKHIKIIHNAPLEVVDLRKNERNIVRHENNAMVHF